MTLPWLLAVAATDPSPVMSPDISAGLRGLVAVFVVLGLVTVFAWLLKRGTFGPLGRRVPSAIRVETAAPLGERRSVVIVAVEGRRLLLGLAPGQIVMLTELQPAGPAFSNTLDRATAQSPQASL